MSSLNVEVPPELKNVVALEELLDALNNENANDVAKRIVVDFEYFREIEELVSFIIIFFNTRHKINSFGKLCRILYDSIGEKFKIRILEKAPKLLIRSLYNEGIITLDDVKKKIVKDNELTFFFAPEIEIQEDLFQYYEMRFIEDNFDKLKADDWKLYKELLQYGYLKETKEFLIKFDEIETLKSKFPDIEPNADIETSPFDADREVSYISLAAFYGSEKCFRFLLEERNAEIDDKVIQNAAKGGNMNIIKLLESKGSSFENSFLSAIEFHRQDVFSYFLKTYENNEPSFNDCISLGNILAYIYYLQSGCDPNESDCYGWTSLPLAAMNAQISLVKYLVKRGCDINAVAVANTALHYACGENNYAVVKFLLENGADVSAVDMSQQTPLHIAASKGFARCAHLLVSKGADMNAQDEDEYTPVNFMPEDDIMNADISEEKFSYKDVFSQDQKNAQEDGKEEISEEKCQEEKNGEDIIHDKGSACCLLI